MRAMEDIDTRNIALLVNMYDDVTCQWEDPPCGKRARWRGTTRCCKRTYVMCTKHRWRNHLRIRALRIRDAMRGRRPIVVCGICRTIPMPPIDWERL